MSVWIRQDVDIHDHPDLIDAAGEVDGWALVAWQTCLRVIKAHGRDGSIDPKWVSGTKLARYALWGPAAAPHLEAAREALVRHGLLRIDADGRVCVPGWSAYQIDPRPAGRTRVGECNRVPGTDRDAPGQVGTSQGRTGTHSAELGHPAYGTGQDSTGQDVTGQETDKTPPPPVGGAEDPCQEIDDASTDRTATPTDDPATSPGPVGPAGGGAATTRPADAGPGLGGPGAGGGDQGAAGGGLRADRPVDPLVAPAGLGLAAEVPATAPGSPSEPVLALTCPGTPAKAKKPRAGAASADERIGALGWLWEAWERGPQRHGCPEARPRSWDEKSLRAVELRVEKVGRLEVERAVGSLAHPWSGEWRPALLWVLTTGWSRTADGAYAGRTEPTHKPSMYMGVDLGELPGELQGKLIRDSMILTKQEAAEMLTAAVREYRNQEAF